MNKYFKIFLSFIISPAVESRNLADVVWGKNPNISTTIVLSLSLSFTLCSLLRHNPLLSPFPEIPGRHCVRAPPCSFGIRIKTHCDGGLLKNESRCRETQRRPKLFIVHSCFSVAGNRSCSSCSCSFCPYFRFLLVGMKQIRTRLHLCRR